MCEEENVKIFQVSDPEFKEYGRVIPGYELGELIRELEKMPVTKDVAYVSSVAELEKTAAAKELAEEVYGGMPIQIGYCNGHNQKLNALEYHRDSEVNVAVGENSELDLFEAFNNHAGDERIGDVVKDMEKELGAGNKKPEILACLSDPVRLCALLCEQPSHRRGDSGIL